jgi:hypothetical protein
LSFEKQKLSEFKKLLDAQAIVAIAESVTSQPKLPQKNYFSGIEGLGDYEDLQDKVYAANEIMYDPNSLEENGDLLVEIREKIAELQTPEALQYGVNDILEDIKGKIVLMETVLQLQESMKKSRYSIVTTFAQVAAIDYYIEYANDTDIDRIEQIGNNQEFIDFIANETKRLSAKFEIMTLNACKKINERIPSFFVPDLSIAEQPQVVPQLPPQQPEPLEQPAPRVQIAAAGLRQIGLADDLEVVMPPRQDVAPQEFNEMVQAAFQREDENAEINRFWRFLEFAQQLWDKATNIVVRVLQRIFG